MTDDLYPKIYANLQAIPRGYVVTYKQLAKLVPCGPRQVGHVLSSLPADTRLPWHRVINSAGKISVRPSQGQHLQRERLEQEGVCFSLTGKIDLKRFQWQP
jgi:methylated-DNA-protein-cysteine methyltransferase-like protein